VRSSRGRSSGSGSAVVDRRAGLARFVVGIAAVALVAASCSNGSSSDASASDDEELPSSTQAPSGGGASQAAFVPEGPEAAVADYLDRQGIEYVGDCANAELPRDRGKWCSTLVEGADSDEQKVYEVGPVGEDPEQILTVDRRGRATLTPGLQVDVADGDVGVPRQLTPEQLRNDPFIAGNIILDQEAGIGNGLDDLGAVPPADTGGGGTGGGGTGGGGTGGGGTGGGGTTVTPEPGADDEYPPEAEIVVEDPEVTPGSSVVFRGGGCIPNETLQVLFDGKQVGTLPSDAEGNFAGSLKVPVGTAPGSHLLTVKGQVCQLNATITVLGGLAFTGTSNDTSTTVLIGVAAVVFGFVLVVGSRRRRRSGGRRTGSLRSSP
jgi:hypothetical protein